MSAIRKLLTDLANDENGASMAEYALLLAVLTVGIAAAVPALTNTLQGGILNIANVFAGLATP